MKNNIQLNYERLSLMMYDQDKVISVINAYTVYKEIYIDDMWYDSQYTDNGYGKALLHELKCLFQNNRFDNINLCTSQFQAPAFYLKYGFKLEFIRENDNNPKLNKFFFCKKFNDSS